MKCCTIRLSIEQKQCLTVCRIVKLVEPAPYGFITEECYDIIKGTKTLWVQLQQSALNFTQWTERGKVVARERGKNWLFPFFFLDRKTRATPSGFWLNINAKLF